MNSLYANVSYDRAIWMAIPQYWGPEAWESPEAWGREMAETWWNGFKHRRRDVERLATGLAGLAAYYGFRNPEEPEVVAYLHLPNPGMRPLMVKVMIIEDPSVRTLADISNADDPDTIERPIVEEFTTPHLGTGVRSLRYYEAGLSADGASGDVRVYAMLHYAFLIPDEDAFLLTRTLEPDLGRLMQAMEDIDAFVREIRWAHEPLTYANGQEIRWTPEAR